MLPGATGFGWNAAAHQYYSLDSGRFVPRSAIRDGLESLIDASAIRMNNLAEKLQAGSISLADWQMGMMQQIKAANIASAALANGGWAQMTQSNWGATGQMIREQYDYLRNFATQIANGEQPLDGRFLVRSDMYGDAANGTYSEMERRSMAEDGYDEGRRILESGADHCDDCEQYASEGWMPIEDIPAIGDSACVTRCRCTIEYRNSSTGEDNGG